MDRYDLHGSVYSDQHVTDLHGYRLYLADRQLLDTGLVYTSRYDAQLALDDATSACGDLLELVQGAAA